MVLGIVGKIGSGKSAVVKYLQEEYGAIAFSCDEVAKEIMKEENFNVADSEEIFINENFSEKIRIELHPKVFSRIFENINILYNFLEENALDNNENKEDISILEKKLNINIFSNILNKNNFLNYYEDKEIIKNYKNNKIVINEKNENILKKYNFKKKNEFYSILIIIESALPSDDMFKICDKIIYIDSPYEDRVCRLKESRNYTEEKIKLIYDSQAYYEKFYDRADYKVMNDASKDDLRNKIKEVIDEIYIASK